MTAPDFTGEVRLGVPHDVVGPYMPPVLKSFDQAWPGVRVSLDCRTSVNLLRALERREVDLILTTERACAPHGETLLPDALVWAGARHGRAYKRDPLPVSIGGEDCAFRPFAIEALNHAGRDWRPVCEISNLLAECAAVEADLAVVPLLASTVPDTLTILGAGDGLPPLPMFQINLYLPQVGASEAAVELARPHPRAVRRPLPPRRLRQRGQAGQAANVANSAVGGDAAAISARTRSTSARLAQGARPAVRGDGPRPGARGPRGRAPRPETRPPCSRARVRGRPGVRRGSAGKPDPGSSTWTRPLRSMAGLRPGNPAAARLRPSAPRARRPAGRPVCWPLLPPRSSPGHRPD